MAHSHWIGWIALLVSACCASAHGVDEVGRRAAQPRTERMALPAEVLDRYTGVYVIRRRLDRETWLTIRRHGEHLSLEISGVPGTMPLHVQSETVFAGPDAIELTFLGSGPAAAPRLRYRQRSVERIAERADMGLEF